MEGIDNLKFTMPLRFENYGNEDIQWKHTLKGIHKYGMKGYWNNQNLYTSIKAFRSK